MCFLFCLKNINTNMQDGQVHIIIIWKQFCDDIADLQHSSNIFFKSLIIFS